MFSNDNYITHETEAYIEGICPSDECPMFEEPQDLKATINHWRYGTPTMDYKCGECGQEVKDEEAYDFTDYDAMGKALREGQ